MFGSAYFGARYFGPRYFPPIVHTGPVDGAARRQHVQFTAIRDAEAPIYGFSAELEFARLFPTGTADALFSAVEVRAYPGRTVPAAAAFARIDAQSLVSQLARLNPVGDSNATLDGPDMHAKLGEFAPEADAESPFGRSSVVGASSDFYPSGVRNLTDEEMAVLALRLTGKLPRN